MTTEAQNPIKSVETAFRILEEVRNMDGARGADIASVLDMPPSTLHNYLSTLQQEGYLVKEDEEYTLGLRFIYFGDYAKHRLKLYRIAKRNIDELAEQTGEMANLLVEENGLGIYVAVSRSERALRLESYVQEREHLHCTAVGKAILAYLNDDRLLQIVEQHGLPQMTENTITTPERLHTELETVHERGIAFDREERLNGLQCCAAPILENGVPLGAVSVSGPKSRMQGQVFDQEVPQMVRDTANAIEIDLVHSTQ
ncbi:IclR family transcriptional regulator [Halocatena marina]|uniref:IclR family transcriptional regulator n=1 Tax=Halocatena marina TaxID=2934937 RepID=A0ABD5YP53_9EURY|nr:IclR family transcriptional regulator [Halocatena marina]